MADGTKISELPDGTAINLVGTELWPGVFGGVTYRFNSKQVFDVIPDLPDGTALILEGTELLVGTKAGVVYKLAASQLRAGALTKRTVTAAGAITIATSDQIVLVAKTVAAVTAINLPAATSFLSDELFIKDLNGVFASFNATVNANGAETIDGLAAYPMIDNYAHLLLGKKTSGWYVKSQ